MRLLNRLLHAITLAAAGLLMLGASADELPLPKDVKNPIPPIEVMIGRQPVRLQAFRTKLNREQLFEFYQKAFEKSGWTVSKLSWQEAVDSRLKTLDDLEKQVPSFRDYVEDPEAKQWISKESLSNLKTKSANTLHASRGQERIMLNCYPSKTGWMGVYLSRWSGDTLTGKPVDMAASAGLGQAAGKASSWPETNACCTGQSVPNASRKLPLSIPDFPYARMVSVASSGQQPEIISALYSTAATQSEVMEYYRKQMTYDGWRLISDQPHMASVLKERAPTVFGGREIAAGQLSFRGPQGTCLISTTESLGADPQAKDAKKEGKVKERTIIAINYMNLTLEGATRRIGKRRPAESNTGKDGLNNDTTNLQ